MVSLTKPLKKVKASVYLFMTIIFFFSLSVILLPVVSQAQPDWSWAFSAGGSSNDYGKSICTDINGNIYTTGSFSESITFGNFTLIDDGGDDIFLVKYNTQGDVIWAFSYGGTSSDYASKVTIGVSGNLIITGAFKSESITFGDITLTNPNSGNGYDAFFVGKINPDGNVIWASTTSGDGNCRGTTVDTDNDGNVIVTGLFDGVSTTFGTITLNNSYQFASDIFLVKYSESGDVVWAQSFGGDSYDYGSGVATNSNGNINLTGAFMSSSITFGTTTFTNQGGFDYFLVQFDSSGNIVWLRNAIGDGDDISHDIATDNNDNVFVTGTYAGTSITFELTTLPGNGYDNIFILKYNNAGQTEWVHSASGNENDEAYALTVDNDGSVLVTGEFESNPITFGAFSLTNSYPDYSDLFVTKINPEGIFAWAISAGGNDDDYGLGISTFSNGNAYLIGSFNSSVINFGTTSLVNTNNNPDYFIAKLNSTTGISDETLNRNYIIYPNPAKNFVQINTTTNANIEISNMAGQSLIKTEISLNNTTVDISNLTPGFYFVKVYIEEKIIINKMIKE